MIWIITIFDIFLFIEVVLSWQHVFGMLGGYGKGVWAESSSYMIEAREHRRNITLLFLLFTALTIGAWLE